MERTAKILVIDDEASFLKAVSLSLSDRHEVTCFTDVRDAVHMIEGANVIISDFKMQFLDGHEVLKLAKQRSPLAPVILVSAYADKQMAIQAANLHVFAILEKPVDFHLLRDTVDRAWHQYNLSFGSSPLSFNEKPDFIALNEESLSASFSGKSVRLTLTEFRLISFFMKNSQRAVAREKVMKEIWGEVKVAENVLDTHLGNIKKKLPTFAENFTLVRGKGYFYKD